MNRFVEFMQGNIYGIFLSGVRRMMIINNFGDNNKF